MAKLPGKLTQKQENFCLEYVASGLAADAYRSAYAADNMQPATVRRRAAELLDLKHVQARIAELRASHADRHKITVDQLLDELEEARRAALTAETPQSAAAVSATMSKAKLLGLDKQILEHTGPGGAPLGVPTIIQLVAPGSE